MKTDHNFQEKYRKNQFYNNAILTGISENVKLHDEVQNPLSSAAACLNVFGYLNQNLSKIIPFFKEFGVLIDEVIDFPSGINLDGEIYSDNGPIIFEWIGPKKSAINEKGGTRGQNRTSIDAFFIAKINGKYTQVFIEWKFTESYNSGKTLHNFGGLKGIERLRRYSTVPAKERSNNFPFNFKDEDPIGLQDFSYEPFYQLLRMTLLAKETTPIIIGKVKIENYNIIHLVHSENNELLNVDKDNLKYCPSLLENKETDLHKLWISLLSDEEKKHFYYGYWNKAIKTLDDKTEYLKQRYE
jgi:hypothetical protein